MTSVTGKTIPEDKKAIIRLILTISGVIFGAMGITILLMPSMITNYMGAQDNSIALIFGAALLMVGISDIAIARILFKQTINTLNHKETDL